MTINQNLHPDDVLFFYDVRKAMFNVAKTYKLPLRSITPMSMPESGMADRLGDCTQSGHIRIVMRATVDGVFCDKPRTPALVWQTAAHELAHLRHMNHGAKFEELAVELMQAIENQCTDHREKVLAKLVKMQAMHEGFVRMGSTNEAEAFAGMINKMLLDHDLQPSSLDYATATGLDPVIEVPVDKNVYGIQAKGSRVAWQETLARIVAKANLCTFLIRSGSNDIIFVGTKSHAVIAEYVYGTLVPAAVKMCYNAYHQYGLQSVPTLGKWKAPAPGFNEAWLAAFIDRVGERFNEARQQAVVAAPEGTSVALMRLDGALEKVKTYIDDKFKSRRGGNAAPLASLRRSNREGARQGRAAADALAIGRKGVEGGARKRIG
jgi:hypothetical protein